MVAHIRSVAGIQLAHNCQACLFAGEEKGGRLIYGWSAEPAVAADGAGITRFRDMMPLQPAPLLICGVRRGGACGDPRLRDTTPSG